MVRQNRFGGDERNITHENSRSAFDAQGSIAGRLQ